MSFETCPGCKIKLCVEELNKDTLVEDRGEFMYMQIIRRRYCPKCGFSTTEIDYDESTATGIPGNDASPPLPLI
jgi:hypothetical protein